MADVCNGKDQKEVLDENGPYDIYGSGGAFGKSSEYLYDQVSVLLGRKGTINKPLYIEKPFWTVDTMFYTRIHKGMHPRYFFYLCLTIPFDYHRDQTTLPSMTQSGLSNIRFAIAPQEDQRKIAEFLDWKTEQIDALMARKKELLERLREKRIALITQTVTRGLQPNAPMRESGIPWLGQVPQHWEVKKLKFIGEPFIGLTYAPDDIVDERNGTLVLRANNIQDGRLVSDDPVYVSTEIPESLRMVVGDILICTRNGSRHLIGKNGLVTDEFAGATFGAFNTVFRSEANRFLYWVFNSYLFEYQSGSYLTSTINQLTINTLSSMVVPLPGPAEREEIAFYLDAKVAKLDSLALRVQTAIDRLAEYRIALITAATTGKIDVRKVKPPNFVA